ncbi:MAG: hypothetical protein B7X98_01475 [Methylophilaceae bacterium 17-43-7]|nr:MAG: hypothetical protein B7X98_01475 [Methylophilaceae bacterium 17-43-7]
MIAFEGNGILTEFGGGYDDWQRFHQQQLASEKSNEVAASKANTVKTENLKSTNAKAVQKLSFKEEKELSELPMQIEKLEAEKTQINLTLADPNYYREQAEKVKPLQLRLTEIDSAIEAKMLRWELLESKSA